MRLTEKKGNNGNNYVVEFFCMMPVSRTRKENSISNLNSNIEVLHKAGSL
jgi:hypothetical protein